YRPEYQKRKDKICPFSSLAFFQPTTVDKEPFFLCHTLRKSLQTTSVLYETSKLCFEQPATSFLVCSLIFIEYQFEWKMGSYHIVMS
ncbi:hypothetical protein ACRE1T_10080, partial [Streptococcus pneumoniae]